MTRSLLTLTVAGLALAACEGPNEKAGEKADRAAGLHDSLISDGPGEKAGRAIDQAMKADAQKAKSAPQP